MAGGADNLEQSLGRSLPQIESMGVCLFDPIWARQMHTSRICEVLHVISGQVKMITEPGHFAAGPGDTLIIPSGVSHRDEFDFQQGLRVFMVFFTWGQERSYFAGIDWPACPRVCAAAKAQIGRTFEHMRAGLGEESAADKQVREAQLLAILLLMRLSHATVRLQRDRQPEDRRRQLMLQAKAWLEEHYRRPVRLEEIAAGLGVSPFYLSHAFSQQSDFSLFGYLTALRMNRAHALLAEGRLKIGAVAREVGYENGNYFAKVFRRYFGYAPSKAGRQSE